MRKNGAAAKKRPTPRKGWVAKWRVVQTLGISPVNRETTGRHARIDPGQNRDVQAQSVSDARSPRRLRSSIRAHQESGAGESRYRLAPSRRWSILSEANRGTRLQWPEV